MPMQSSSIRGFVQVMSCVLHDVPSDCYVRSLLHSEHPEDAALRDVHGRAEQAVNLLLLALGVNSPAGLHGDILPAVDLEGDRDGRHARIGAELDRKSVV